MIASRKMRVIVGCEFSGRVRDAFLDLGHDAWSCDIMPSPDRWKTRSLLSHGMVNAMAKQWGSL